MEATSAQGLRGTSYFDVRETDLDWAAWLDKAKARYDQAVAQHVHALAASEAAGGRVVEAPRNDSEGRNLEGGADGRGMRIQMMGNEVLLQLSTLLVMS